MSTLRKDIHHVIEVFSKPAEWVAKPDEPKLKVGEFSSKMASLYEKLRNAVEYDEEHLLRRNAIARILKRRLVRGVHGKDLAKPLIEELIRARYLPNNSLPESILGGVEEIIDKYIFLINKATEGKKRKLKKEYYYWILGHMASELEEYLIPHDHERALVDAMFRTAREEVVFLEDKLSERERDIQLYLAVHRSLLKADHIWLRYQLLKLYYPNWTENNQDALSGVTGRFSALHDEIEKTLKHKLGPYLARHLHHYAVIYWIIKDILDKEPKRAAKILVHPEILQDFVKEACSARYRRAQTVLKRSAVRSVIFIFCTKIVLAFLIELPYDWYVMGEIAWLPLAMNILFHPFVLLLIAATTRVPTSKNTEAVQKGIEWVLYGKGDGKILFKKAKIPNPNTVKGLFTNSLYAVLYLLSFSFIFWGLDNLGFNIVSALLFVLFLSLVSFFGIRIRTGAREMVIIKGKENVLMTIFDFFTLPIVRAGRWISMKSSKINIFVFILDFVIEAPYKMLVEVFDDLISFIKEKKEEVY